MPLPDHTAGLKEVARLVFPGMTSLEPCQTFITMPVAHDVDAVANWSITDS
jgi:hypothetical protein